MLGLFAALAVTIGLLLIALHLLRRAHGAAAGRGAVPLQVLQRIPTGPRQGIALVRVADRVLVVAMAERGTTLLTELEGEALAASLAAASPRPAPTPTMPSFAAVLGRLGVALLLAVVPAAAAAQAQDPAATQPAPGAPAQTQATPAPSGVRSLPPVRIQTGAPAPAPRPPAAQAPAAGPVVTAPAPPKIEFRLGEGDDQVRLSGTVGLVVFMGFLTLLPAMVLLMTSFTRILIVLHFLRSALGTQTTPPGQLLVAIAVLLTGVVMNPVLERANQEAFQPYSAGQITQVEAYKRGVAPFREFMLANTRESDLASFVEMSGAADAESLDDVSTVTIASAFITSELRTAFQMGFVIYLPFIVIDLIVASVLMSMGMFMLPPVMVSLPFKLLLFVLADGWTLVVRNLVASFQV